MILGVFNKSELAKAKTLFRRELSFLTESLPKGFSVKDVSTNDMYEAVIFTPNNEPALKITLVSVGDDGYAVSKQKIKNSYKFT